MISQEKLQVLGSYGLEREDAYPRISFLNPSGHGYDVTIGDARGLASWRLKYDTTSDDVNSCSYDTPEGETQSYFEYLRRFIKRHNYPDKLPFLITCPEDGLEYSVKFADNRFSRTFITFKLWGTGLSLVQFRAIDGLEFGENPISQNNDSI